MPASTDQLHTFAITAEKNLEQLATGIATVGADDGTIKGISKMADACRQIATHLAQGGAAQQPDAAAAPPEAPAGPPSVHQAIANHFAAQRAAAGQPPA